MSTLLSPIHLQYPQNVTLAHMFLIHPVLQQILEKLTKLESLDNRFTEIQTSFDTRFTDLQSSLVTRFTEVKTTLDTRLNEVFTRMTNLEGKLAPFEDLPLLTTRLWAAEEAIEQI